MAEKKQDKQKKKAKSKSNASTTIIIDESRGLVFNSEDEVVEHFKKEIETLEKEYHEIRGESEISNDEIENLEDHLTDLLQEPDEVWFSEDTIEGLPLGIFIGYFETEDEKTNFYYIAVTYFIENTPKFVFLHFATADLATIKKYQRGQKIFDRNNVQTNSDEERVDALTDGDELAVGLYRAMLKLRTSSDIPESEFEEYMKYREETIEEPEEIWKKIDSEGHTLVVFIRSIEDSSDARYVVVTMEDEASESQYLLFSFPSRDNNLMDRYRQGESLDTVSYTREESH